jgi:hypothetical protein
MNTPESSPLEQRLARLPLRGLPPDLRSACLRRIPSPTPSASRRFLNLFRPHPWAWSTLAFAWTLCAVLHWTQPRPVEVLAAQSRPAQLVPDIETIRLLALQRATREELLRPSPPPIPPAVDRPRSRLHSTNHLA